MAKKAQKKSKIRTIFKWVRRISFVAGVVSAVRQWQIEQNDTKQPPQS